MISRLPSWKLRMKSSMFVCQSSAGPQMADEKAQLCPIGEMQIHLNWQVWSRDKFNLGAHNQIIIIHNGEYIDDKLRITRQWMIA